MIYNYLQKMFTHSGKKNNGNKNNKKNIFNKMKEDVQMLKPKKHVNKFGRLTYHPKLK